MSIIQNQTKIYAEKYKNEIKGNKNNIKKNKLTLISRKKAQRKKSNFKNRKKVGNS